MTPRDHYAAAALQGLLASPQTDAGAFCDTNRSAVASVAADMADAMVYEACGRWGHDYEEEPRRNERDVPLRRWCRRCDHQQSREQNLSPCGTHCEYGEWKDGAP